MKSRGLRVPLLFLYLFLFAAGATLEPSFLVPTFYLFFLFLLSQRFLFLFLFLEVVALAVYLLFLFLQGWSLPFLEKPPSFLSVEVISDKLAEKKFLFLFLFL